MSDQSDYVQKVQDFGTNGNKANADHLERIQSIQSLAPEQFEKLFLAPQTRVAGKFPTADMPATNH